MAETTPYDNADTAFRPTEPAPALPIENEGQMDEKDVENSDGDGGERPVREKLKKTSIAGLSKQAEESGVAGKTNGADAHEETNPLEEGNTQRGRPTRKRSFEDLQEDVQAYQEAVSEAVSPNRNSAHKRMRSRDVTNTDNIGTNARTQSRAEEPIREENQSPEEITTARTETISELTEPTEEETEETTASGVNRDEMFSPKKKRSRDQFDKDHNTKEENVSEASSEQYALSGSDPAEGSDSAPKAVPRTAAGEPEKKRHRDESVDRNRGLENGQQTKKASTAFGFGSLSTVSPFGALASSKDPKENESRPERADDQKESQATSTFASSGIAAFAKSESSPFGTAGSTAKSTAGFGGAESGASSGFGFGSISGFGSSSGFGGPSSFAAARPSEFGGSGKGFGSGFGGGPGSGRPLGGLSSFAAPTGSGGIIGISSSTKAFGAPEDAESDDEDDDSDQPEDETHEEKHKDKRFVEQELETGEEEEETVFSCKGKLFHFSDGEWKERGAGTFKVNVSQNVDPESSGTKKARLIMRTEGVHRVALNAPIFKGMKVGSSEGQEPTSKMLNLAAMENGKAVPLALRTGSVDLTRTLYHKILEIQQEL